MNKKIMAQHEKKLGKCGILALIVMAFLGTLFGSIGVIFAHWVMKFHPAFTFFLVLPILIAIFLGIGFSFGARIGRCRSVTVLTFLLILLGTFLCYGSLLFLNDYYSRQELPPADISEEALALVEEGGVFLSALPLISDYLPPLEEQPDGETLRNLGDSVLTFIGRVPEKIHDQVVITKLFRLALLSPFTQYVEYPHSFELSEQSFTRLADAEIPEAVVNKLKEAAFRTFPNESIFLEAVKQNLGEEAAREYHDVLVQNAVYHRITFWDHHQQQLVFGPPIELWMQWALELFLMFLFTFLITRSGTKKAYNRSMAIRARGTLPKEKKVKKEKKKKKKKKKDDAESLPDFDAPEFDSLPEPEPIEMEAEAPQPKKKKKGFSLFRKKKQDETEDERIAEPPAEDKKKKKKKDGWLRRKKKAEPEVEPATPVEEDMSTQEYERYAIILHQYAKERQADLLRLIQQVGQVSEERAQRLLRVPSLIKRDVTDQEARIAIEKFNQVQAQVKLITMQQLQDLQNKQQQAAQPPSAPAGASPQVPPGGENERYALILRKFDTAQRRPVLELLSSLSNTPVAQLQQSLRTPALVLRGATRDEVTMIAQQFQAIQADVKILKMSELQKLMAKKS